MPSISFPLNPNAARVDLSIDFFNDGINIADSAQNAENAANAAPGDVHAEALRAQLPLNWEAQLEPVLDQAMEQEHGGVRLEEINNILRKNGIQLSENDWQDVEGLQNRMAMAMNDLLTLKKSTILVDKWVQEKYGPKELDSTKVVEKTITTQRELATKLRSMANDYPAIGEQLKGLAERCERQIEEISASVNSVEIPARAKEILREMSAPPVMLQNLEAELDNCNVESRCKEAVMRMCQKAMHVWNSFGNPRCLLVIARELQNDAGVDGLQTSFEEMCGTLSELSEALHNLNSEGQSSDALEELADAIDRNVLHIINMSSELPELLEESRGETCQDLMNEVTKGLWKARLDSILMQVSSQEYGNVTLGSINQLLENQHIQLSQKDTLEIENLQRTMEQSMNALHELKGAVIREAYRQDASENIDAESRNVIDAVDNAIMSQQTLAEKFRAVGKDHPEVQGKLENLADKCDRRSSEILATVNDLINPPRAEEILRELGRSPSALKNLESELDNCRIKSSLKATVMQKFNDAMEALRNLGSQNALVLNAEIQHGAPNGELTHFEKACDALSALSEALHGLRGKRHASDALENMADAVDRHVMHILNLGNLLPDLLEAHKDETVKEMIVAAVPQMHGTQEVLAHFNRELLPLMKKLDDFASAPENVHDYGELLMMSDKLTKLKQGLNELVQDGQIQLRNGTRFVADTSLLDPLKELLDKAQASMENYKNFFKNAKYHQLRKSIAQSIPLDVPQRLTKSNFWKNHFPCLNDIVEFSSGLRQLAMASLDNPQEIINRLDVFRQKLNQMRNDENWYRRFSQEISRLSGLQNAMAPGADEDYIDDESKNLVAELRGLASSEKGTGDIISAINTADFEAFEAGMLSERQEVVNYKMLRLAYIFQNVAPQNQLCDEYMKGAMLQRALKENIPLSTIIETRLHNASIEFVDEVCDDTNLVGEPEILGHGQANTVQKCSYRDKDGSIVQKVFKAEYEGSIGNLNLLLAVNGAPNTQTAYLNVASKNVASALHCGEIMPKTSVGMLRGTYGIFMDFVPGYPPANMPSAYSDMLKGLPSDEKHRVGGQLMKRCNQLQWNDILMAQGDRHSGNYGISVKLVDGRNEVRLTAFDNDACLSEWRTGISKINLKSIYRDQLSAALFRTRYIGDEKTFLEQMEAQGGLSREDDGSITLDTSKMNPAQLEVMHWTTGMQSFKLPDYMDKDIYDGLMELEASPAKFDASLPPDISPAARAAAKARLRDMIEIAKQYKNDGKVLDDANWENPDTQRKMAEETRRAIDSAGKKNGARKWLSDLFFRDFSWLLN